MLPEDDDVPVYEPLYPEQQIVCAHPDCDTEVAPEDRICDGCTNLLQSETTDECAFCGQKV